MATKRSNGKWYKITKVGAKYYVAMGYHGNIQAAKGQYWPTKYGAKIAGDGWLAY